MAPNGRGKEERDQVSFISKKHRLKNPTGDAGLFISMLKSNRKNGVKNTLEENFYLERRVSERGGFGGEAEGTPKTGAWAP